MGYGPGRYGGYEGYSGYGSNLWMGLGAGIATLLLIAVVATLVIVLIRRYRNGAGDKAGVLVQSTALQILDERLARGEIDINDYQARKAVLLGAVVPPQVVTPPPVANNEPTSSTEVADQL
jgi:uncharacterized membrane protein